MKKLAIVSASALAGFVFAVTLLGFALLRLEPARAGAPTGQGGTGDVNGDGTIDVSDAVFTLLYLFKGGAEPVACADSPELVARLANLQAELTRAQEEIADANLRIAGLEVPGCTDPMATNFDCRVNFDDGSCQYPGCTDPGAVNYDPAANKDDGSCFFPGDIPGFTFIASNAQGYPEYQHDETGIIFVRLPGGAFNMGSPELECGRDAIGETPVHTVTLTPFLMAKFEVTQAQWHAVAGTGPSPTPNLPMDNISGSQAGAFCALVGLTLPTEAQWEYACRAGTQTVFAYGNTLSSVDEANFNGRDLRCSYAAGNIHLGRTAAVGSYAPNAFGLYDMHGNVSEWCRDTYDHRFYGKPEATEPDPVSTTVPGTSVNRGGNSNYSSVSVDCRSATRGGDKSDVPSFVTGFRPAYWPLP